MSQDGGLEGPLATLLRELHISNIHQREAIYHNSLVSKAATAVIAGLGAAGYAMAVAAIEKFVSSQVA